MHLQACERFCSQVLVGTFLKLANGNSKITETQYGNSKINATLLISFKMKSILKPGKHALVLVGTFLKLANGNSKITETQYRFLNINTKKC